MPDSPKVRFVVASEGEHHRVFVIHDDTPTWWRLIATFPTKLRADNYAEVEQMMHDDGPMDGERPDWAKDGAHLSAPKRLPAEPPSALTRALLDGRRIEVRVVPDEPQREVVHRSSGGGVEITAYRDKPKESGEIRQIPAKSDEKHRIETQPTADPPQIRQDGGEKAEPYVPPIDQPDVQAEDDAAVLAAIATLNARPTINQFDIEVASGVPMQRVSRAIGRLVDAGKVARASKRYDLVEPVHARASGFVRDRFPPLTPKQAETFAALKAMLARGEAPSATNMIAAAGESAPTNLYALEKKGYITHARGTSDWRVLFDGEPVVEVPYERHPNRVRRDAIRAAQPQRRFTDHPPLNPEGVKGLPATHKAIVGGRTLFPSTVVDPSESPRLLVSGANSRKLGDRVTKGPWRGMPIYQLSLEERATCPTSCHIYDACYGNNMPLARRHRHTPDLTKYLRLELSNLEVRHPQGFVVRLHVLGDFFSVEYVEEWAKFLDDFRALHVFGYTAWPRDSEIGSRIEALTNGQWDRFAIRFSAELPAPGGAYTIWRMPENDEPWPGIVCPAETGKTACCGSCGLCWAGAAKDRAIGFIAHGRDLSGPVQPKAPTNGGVKISMPVVRTTPPPKPPVLGAPPRGVDLGDPEPERSAFAKLDAAFDVEGYLHKKGVRIERAGGGFMIEGRFHSRADAMEIVEKHRAAAREGN